MSATAVGGILSQLRLDGADDALLLEGDSNRHVSEARLIDAIDQINDVGAGALLVLDRALSHVADSYLLDVAVRLAVSRRASGLMLTVPCDARVSLTARALCRKSGLALVRLSPHRDVNGVLKIIARELADNFHLTMGRARRAIDSVETLDNPRTAEKLAELGEVVLGRRIRIGPLAEGPDVLAVPTVLERRDGDHYLAEPLPDPDANALLEMVLWRFAAESSRATLMAEQAERVSLHSVGEVLSQLVDADRQTLDDLAPYARKLGVPVDAWHVVTRIELDTVEDADTDELLAFELRERLLRVALATASASGGVWHSAQERTAFWLLNSQKTQRPRDYGHRVEMTITRVLTEMVKAAPSLRTYSGIGGVRSGSSGIPGSATEARLAAAHARTLRQPNRPVSFDATGLRSTIVEWYGLSSVKKSIDALFAPLAKQTPARRDATIEILCTYLDLGGSVSRTADAVYLHRNAVRARLNSAVELLGVDIEDPDQRLFLHLACRSRRITAFSPRIAP